MLESDGKHFNQRWGFLSRAGLNDKSQLMRQVEKYADIYTSRVSNFLRYSPFMYFRSPSQSLAHDRYELCVYGCVYHVLNGCRYLSLFAVVLCMCAFCVDVYCDRVERLYAHNHLRTQGSDQVLQHRPPP